MSFANWRKCDFQIHTPRDPGWKGARPPGVGDLVEKGRATVVDMDRERNRWARALLDHCSRAGLEAIAVTDHHEMVMIPYLQQAIIDRKAQDPSFDLWLFPGMELTCRNGCQCIIIFDADLPEEWRKQAQTHLGIVVADLDVQSRQAPKVTQLAHAYPDIACILDSVEQLVGRYIVLPNLSEGGKHTVLKQGAHADFKRMPYVGGYIDNAKSVDSLGTKNKRRISGRDSTWGSRAIYPLSTSDVRTEDYAKLGTNNCWIKLAEPTAEAIRQAFLGHRSRISINPPAVTSLAIGYITIQGTTILADTSLQVSPELNAFIGGRGSGKSTFLEYIAFGLGRSCYDLEKAEYSGANRLSKTVVDSLISSNASIELRILQDGAVFNITRSSATSYNPVVTYPDGSSQELSLKELRSLFPAVVYSQGELSEIGKQAGRRSPLSELLQFVEPEFKKEDERLNSEIDKAKHRVRKAVQGLADAWINEAQQRKLKASKTSLQQRIMALQKTLPDLPEEDRAHLSRYEKLAELDSKRQVAARQVQSYMDELAKLWRASKSPADLSSEAVEADEIQTTYENFRSALLGGLHELGDALAPYRKKFNEACERFDQRLSASKIERDKAMEKLTEHRSVTIQIGKLQEELQELLAQLGGTSTDLPDQCSQTDTLETEMNHLKGLVEQRARKTMVWAEKIEALSNNRIRARLNIEGDISELFEAVDIVTTKSGSQEGIRHQRFDEYIYERGVWPAIDVLRNECLDALRWNKAGIALDGERPKCQGLCGAIGATERTIENCIDLMDISRVEAIATATPKPDIALFYCDEDREISFEKASEGQRAAALLFMLLEQPGGPLIVDQPEGDLDNKIVSHLAEKLHTAKQHRQIIFASHNANIVVNGSSELVVSLEVSPDAKRNIGSQGAIDIREVREKITETMEGGEIAFRSRKEKYGY